MAKFNEQHVFTGMQRDIDVSRHPASFLYDARNIRLTQRDGEGDTLYAITNEKGTELTSISIVGIYLGHVLLNQYLVIFSKDAMGGASPDWITRIDLSTLTKRTLYQGDLGFDFNYPISAIGYYENESIQKVYWVDGKNQPRVINIVGDIKLYLDTQFDFLPILSLKEKVYVTKQTSATGSFPPGVIQYMFTYYRKFGQESNIFYTTPLLYISPLDRGGAPDEKISNSFKINIKDIDLNFDYIRIYSLQRTSLNSTPIAKLVRDIAILTEIKKKQGTSWVPISDYVFSYGEPIVGVLRDNIFSPLNYIEEATATTVGQFQLRFYKYPKAKYPDLCIRVYTQDKKPWYIRWYDSTDSSEVVYISEPYTHEVGNIVRVIGAVSEEGSHVWNENSLEFLSSNSIEKDCLAEYTFIDTGVEGESVDPSELLYKQREAIIVNTLDQKDNTVFLGGIQYEHEASPSLPENTITIAPSNRTIKFKEDNDRDTYIYYDQLNALDSNKEKNVPCGGFKRGEYYRLGVQFQDKFGKWSDPLYIDDVQETNWPAENWPAEPPLSEYNITLPTFTGTISSSYVKTLIDSGYKKARAVVVFPDIQDREILCQGVTCPTVYRQRDVFDSAIGEESSTENKQCQSSWFFRPVHSNVDNLVSSTGTVAPTYTGEIPTSAEIVGGAGVRAGELTTLPRRWEIQGYYKPSNRFYVASSNDGYGVNLNTFHSPDVEFSSDIISQSFNSTMYKIVGYTEITKTFSDIDIQTKSPTISNMGSGFDHHSLVTDGAKGIISGLFYDDFVVDEMKGSNPINFRDYDQEQSSVKWLVYPWHRSGSLNNDINRPSDAGTRSAELLKKKISNLRYGVTSWIKNNNTPGAPSTPDDTLPRIAFESNKPELFMDDSPSILKIGNTIYKGNVDTVLMPDLPDGYYFCFNDSITDTNIKAFIRSNPDKSYAISNIGQFITTVDNTSFTSPVVALNETEFTSESWWKTFATLDGQTSSTSTVNGTVKVATNFGNVYIQRKINDSSYVNEGSIYDEGTVGTPLILNVVPQNGYSVTYWRKGGSEGKVLEKTSGMRSIQVTVDYGTNVYYAQLTYKGETSSPANTAHIYLLSSPNNAGVIIGEGDYAIGSTATIRATPNSGYDFVAWKDSNNIEISTERSTSIIVPSTGGLYTAYFEESGEKIVHFLLEGSGYIEADEDTYISDSDVEYAYGTIINLSVTEDLGVTYFAYWLIDDVVVLEEDTTLQVTQEHRVKAVFPNLISKSTQTYTLQGEGDISLEVLGTSFEVALLNNKTTFPIGTELKLIAAPQEGYRFASWSINDNGTTISSGLNPCNYIIEGSSCTITAVFESSQSTNRIVTFSEYPSTGGEIIANSVSYNDGNTATYTLGETIQLNVTPTYQTGLHYVFDYWLIDGELSRNQNTSLVIASNHSVKAYYKKDPSWASWQTFYMDDNQGFVRLTSGTIMENGDETTSERGTVIQFTAVPKEGYVFDHWIIDDEDAGTQSGYTLQIRESQHKIRSIFTAASSNIKVYVTSNTSNTTLNVDSTRSYVLTEGEETAIDYTEGMVLEASNSGKTWKHWWRTSDDTRYSTSNPLTLTGLTADLHLSAVFI